MGAKNNYGPSSHWGGGAISLGGSERPRHMPRVTQWSWGSKVPGDRGALTPCLSASGAVHLTGSRLESSPFRSALARPKSLILATRSSEMRMLRAARSRCTSFLLSRYSMPSATCLGRGRHRGSSYQVKNSRGQAPSWFPLDLRKPPSCPPGATLTGKTAGAGGCSQGPGPEFVGSSPGCPVEGGGTRLGFEASWLPPPAPPAPQPRLHLSPTVPCSHAP